MRDYMRSLLSSNRLGLATIQVPTGAGKSYEAATIIKELADNPEEHRKIIYLTSLNKNLLDKDLEAMYGDDKEGFRTRVLRLRANRDEVVDKILTLGIPDSFKSDSYMSLCSSVKTYRKAKEANVRDKSYIDDLEKRVDESERKFRRELSKRIAREFSKKSDRLMAIHMNNDYKWIGELYPAVFTDERQILVMSVSKFLKRNSTIIEKSYEFLKADFLNEAIIVIDEFDSTKKVIQADIIKRALNMKEDYISLFRQIKHTFVMDNMSRDMKEAASRITGNITTTSLADECNSIWERYYLGLSYKVADTDMNRSQNFLIKDGTFHSILQNGAQYIRTAKEDDENRVIINFENKSDFYSKRKEDDIIIYGMLREIGSFLNHFRILVYSWGNKYADIVNNRRRTGALLNEDEMSLESAVDSILSKLDLTEKQKYIITSELCGSIVSRNTKELIQDTSFYQRGMEVFSFKDHDNHNDYTELEFVQILDTPEKILAYLAERALIVGISATANIPSVIANYDLKYLKDEALGQLFLSMDEESTKRIRQSLERKWTAYSDGRINIHTEIVRNIKGGFDLDDVCRKIFDNEELGDVAANKIRQMGVNDYYQMRYCNVLMTMHAFMKKESLQSMLYLGMALPKKDSDEMNEDLIHSFEELIQEDIGVNKSFVVILRGDNFDEEKEELLGQLSAGEKKYILSSYQTIGAGQNLQYNCIDKSKYIELVPYKNDGDKRHFTKDIDAIYLGDITNKTINTIGNEAISDEDLLNMLVQIEELYSSGELNFKQMDDAMRCAFDAHKGKKVTNPLSKTRSVQLLATGYVLQAVGRICRTHIKSPDIYIWIDEELVEALDTRELCARILPPEMKAIVALKAGLGKEYTSEEQLLLNKAEKTSSYGNWWIHQKLSKNWTESSMQLWQAARNTVLIHPTANENVRDENELVRKLYVTAGAPIDKYLYSQYSDFSDVTIDFSMDAIAFRNSGRAKHKGETSEVVVSTVSAEDAKLYTLVKYPGMREFFETNNYALDFIADQYIMSPVVFHNIYKGILGEVAGKFILKAERGIELHEITDPDKFEFFDYEMTPDVYVDFKNWKFTYAQDREKTIAEISRKLDEIGAKRAYIINIVADDNVHATTSVDGRIVEIPALIDEDGHVIGNALDKILREDYET